MSETNIPAPIVHTPIVHTIELRVRLVLELVPLVLPAVAAAQPVAAVAPVEPPAAPPAKPTAAAPRRAPPRAGGRPKNAASPEQRERALAAYQRGATFIEAAREVGVSSASVLNWVREAGLPVRIGSWAGAAGPAKPRAAEAPAAKAGSGKVPGPDFLAESAKKPPSPAAPSPESAAPAAPARPPPPAAAPPARGADDAAIAAAVAAGRVTRLPDATEFAKLAAIADAAAATAVLEGAGRTVRRSGGSWAVDGRKTDFAGLIQQAQAAQRQALLQAGAGAQ